MEQIGCKHEDKWEYTFELKEETIDFCKECYKKLFFEMINDLNERYKADKLFRESGLK